MPLFFACILFFIGTVLTGPQGSGRILEDHKVYYPPPIFFQHFNFGQKEALADVFWLRLVQDFDLCASEFSSIDGKPEDLTIEKHLRICNQSWGYRMLDIITDLAPRFRMPNAVGGLNLSVLLNDFEGASRIFDKAVQNFPKDWPILFRASYFYMSDGADPVKGAALARKAVEAGAPDWLNLTAATLYTKTGQKEMGLKVLKDYRDSLQDEKAKAYVQSKIDALETQKD